jgi:hypothetical protein|tara:strand:+ start:183 stop:608 length:426 start_codon:yes stop_codon:yes gene_type:complete
MLAELAIANAAFQVIKQTLSNGKEIADAGSALTKYFSASQSIQQKAKMGTGDVLAAYQAKQAIERQEKELEFMLNKQGLLGYYKYQQFRDEFHNNQKQAAKKRKVQQAKLNSNINDGLKAMGIVIIIMAACFGVAYYLGTY